MKKMSLSSNDINFADMLKSKWALGLVALAALAFISTVGTFKIYSIVTGFLEGPIGWIILPILIIIMVYFLIIRPMGKRF